MIPIAPRQRFPLLVTGVAAMFLGLFLVYPLWKVFGASFFDGSGTHFTLRNYLRLATSSFYRSSVLNSLTIGALATLAATALAVPFAVAVARIEFRDNAALVALASLPLVLPSFVSAYALVLLFGRAGVVTRAAQGLGIPLGSIYGAPGIILVYAFTLFPYVLLPTIAGLKAIDQSLEEAAQNLGASRLRVLSTVTLPLAFPAILSGALLVFIDTLENFGVPFVLAEDKPILAVEAFKLFVGETGQNPAAAGVLGVMLVLCTSLVLLLQRRYLGRRRFATAARQPPPPFDVSPAVRLLATLYCWSVVALALIPFVAAVVVSFLEFRGPVLHFHASLGNFAELWRRAARPLENTLLLSLLAAVATVVLGVPIGYAVTRFRSPLTGLLDILATIPFAVAGTVLGIGFILAFNAGPLVLTGGWLIMVLAYTVRKLPFGVRAASAILHQIDPSLEEASISLGVSPLMTFLRLTVPLMLGGIVGGMVLTWVTVASELSSTIVLYSGPWQTLTVVMFQALEGTGAGTAAAAASLLIVLTLLPVALIFRLLRRYELSMM
ncbi:MAG TPA: iron ABC transporter permease [Stellaceae bacterium]|nr:iron ABC transporter permease [Stellaceae bacterium]